MKHYKYVGPKEIIKVTEMIPKGNIVSSPEDVLAWIEETNQQLDWDNCVVATFIIDRNGFLLIADRHSEHVACAGREDVLSAGEITLEKIDEKVSTPHITNQSTGYCPEPKSWPAVEYALNRAHIDHPGRFTTEFIFRRCEECGALNIVKDNWYVCLECNANLNEGWNIR